MFESQTREDHDFMPLGYEKSQFHMHAGSSPEYTEERKDLSMHDRRSSPHYQWKRANISYQVIREKNIVQAHGHAQNRILRESRVSP